MSQYFSSKAKIGALSESGGTITLADSHIKIGGQGFDTGELTLSVGTATANELYMIYAVRDFGSTILVKSTNYNSVGPAGYDSWKLVGAFYAGATDTFGSFVNIDEEKREYASNSDTSEDDDTSSFQYGPSGQEADYTFDDVTAKRVRFQTPIQTTDVLTLEFSEDKENWFKIPFSASGGGRVEDFNAPNNTGVLLKAVSGSNTDVDVFFGRYRISTTHWTDTTFYWRVVKISNSGTKIKSL